MRLDVEHGLLESNEAKQRVIRTIEAQRPRGASYRMIAAALASRGCRRSEAAPGRPRRRAAYCEPRLVLMEGRAPERRFVSQISHRWHRTSQHLTSPVAEQRAKSPIK